MYTVLDALGTRLLVWKYWMRLLSSDWVSLRRELSDAADTMRVVSSAYVYSVELGTVFRMSLM